MRKSFLFALKNTYTIGISWIPIALAFGLLAQSLGYSAPMVGLSCLICPFGSLQMIAFTFAAGNVAWYTMLLTATAISFRHLFYGLSFLERFKRFGAVKHYIIYMLCDEAYSIFCSAEISKELNERQVHVMVSLLLQFYWLSMSTLFTFLGSFIPFDLTGVEFALTALFTVIFVDMLRSAKTRLPAICAGICGAGCLMLFGPDSFLIPALLISTAVLLMLRQTIERLEKEVRKNA